MCIDLYWDKSYYREQIKAFEHQLGIAKETGLPVIIHSRDSLEVIFEVLKKHPYTRGILHCFPGNAAEARQAIDMGYLLGNRRSRYLQKSQIGRYPTRNRPGKHRAGNRFSLPDSSPFPGKKK